MKYLLYFISLIYSRGNYLTRLANYYHSDKGNLWPNKHNYTKFNTRMKHIFTLLFSIITVFTSHIYSYSTLNNKSVENLAKAKSAIKEHIINQFKTKGNYTEYNLPGKLLII